MINRQAEPQSTATELVPGSGTLAAVLEGRSTRAYLEDTGPVPWRFRSPIGARYLARRVLASIFAVWSVLTITFIALNTVSNPVGLFVPPDAPESVILRTEQILGLNRPVIMRYFTFLAHALQGRFPDSLEYQSSSFALVLNRLPATLELAGTALVIGNLLGLVIGYGSALGRRRVTRDAPMVLAVVLHAFPSFILGIILVFIFAIHLHWFPATGNAGLSSVVLPAVTLSMLVVTPIARVFRTSVRNAMAEDHVRTATAKGLSVARVRLRHVVANAALPVLTVIGLQSGLLLGGTVIVEQVFSWPGVGQLAVAAVLADDYPLVLADTTVVAIGFITVNLLIDVLYAVLDPRARVD